jgi:hypothetical protein
VKPSATTWNLAWKTSPFIIYIRTTDFHQYEKLERIATQHTHDLEGIPTRFQLPFASKTIPSLPQTPQIASKHANSWVAWACCKEYEMPKVPQLRAESKHQETAEYEKLVHRIAIAVENLVVFVIECLRSFHKAKARK